jgi:hypothetical protein
MDTAKIKEIVNITLNGVPSSSYSWDATRINSNSYRVNINLLASLNEMSLTINFLKPDMVIDSEGTVLEQTTHDSPLPSVDFIS